MNERPDEWLERLFEYEYCAECGGDAGDHEVAMVLGNYFAWCRPVPGDTEVPVVAQPFPQSTNLGRGHEPCESAETAPSLASVDHATGSAGHAHGG